MKIRHWFLFLILVLSTFFAQSNDLFLLPEAFFLQKGDTLNVHLLSSNQLANSFELKYSGSQTAKFNIYEGNKKNDLKAMSKDSASSLLKYKTTTEGLALIEMSRNFEAVDLDKTDFANELDQEGLLTISDKVSNANQNIFRVKYASFIKSLLTVGKPTGNLYNKELVQPLELLLEQNPYKLSYGDDITAQVNFKGKPLVNCHADLLIKTYSGKIYPQKINSDAAGKLYFKLSREGIYVLRLVWVEASATKDADYEKWMSAYSFAFSNTGTLPNTYREFGFGNKH